MSAPKYKTGDTVLRVAGTPVRMVVLGIVTRGSSDSMPIYKARLESMTNDHEGYLIWEEDFRAVQS